MNEGNFDKPKPLYMQGEIEWAGLENDQEVEQKIMEVFQSMTAYQPREANEESLNHFANKTLEQVGFHVTVETKWVTFEENKRIFHLETKSPKTANTISLDIELNISSVSI